MVAKFLLVEDDPDVSDFYEMEIKDHFNCEIIKAPNGKIGLEKSFAETYSLIVTDYAMPIENGLWMISQIRKNKSNPNYVTPIIFVSGFKEEFIDDAETYEKVHVTDKPISISTLINKISLFTKIVPQRHSS